MNSLNIFDDKKLVSLDIVFENCEVYNIPAEGIYRMAVDDLNSSFIIHYNGLDSCIEKGEIHSDITAKNIWLALNEIGLQAKSSWADSIECNLLKDRLYESSDISHFDFNFSDNSHIYIAVDWDGFEDYEYSNKLQNIEIKDNIGFIGIGKEYINNNQDFFKKVNNECKIAYDWKNKTDKEKINFSEHLKNILNDEIEKIEIEDDKKYESFNYSVPNYVISAFILIDSELSRVMWNKNQEEFPSPFENTGENFKNDTFEVEAYSWDDEYDQPYNFKWRDYKVRWYKHMRRDPEANRNITPEECAEMLDECLKSLEKMDINDENLFDDICSMYDVHYCVQCGEETDYKELKNGKWACEKCLNNLGKEQHNLKEELENALFEFGFDNYEDLTNCLETFIDVLKYAKSNTTIETMEHLIKSLEAININIKLENKLLDEEKTNKINEMLENW